MKFSFMTPGVLLLAVGILSLQIIYLFWEAAAVHIVSLSAVQVLLTVQLCSIIWQELSVSAKGGFSHGGRS